MVKIRLERLHNVWFHLYDILEKVKNYREKRLQLLDIGIRGGTGYKKRPDRGFGGTREMFCIWTVVLVTGLYAFVKTQNCPLKRVNFTICPLHLNKLVFKKKTTKTQLFGTESLFMPKLYYVLYNSLSKMYPVSFKKVILLLLSFLGLHNHHLVDTKFGRNGTQEWEFLIGVSGLNRVLALLNDTQTCLCCPCRSWQGHLLMGHHTRAEGFHTELERRHLKGGGMEDVFSSLVLSGRWPKCKLWNPLQRGFGWSWALLIFLMLLPEPFLDMNAGLSSRQANLVCSI